MYVIMHTDTHIQRKKGKPVTAIYKVKYYPVKLGYLCTKQVLLSQCRANSAEDGSGDNTHTYTHIHTYETYYTDTHTHTYTHIHIHTYTHTYICMKRIQIHTHTHTHTHRYIRTKHIQTVMFVLASLLIISDQKFMQRYVRLI